MGEPSDIHIYPLFLYKRETLQAYISLHIEIFTYFCLGMLGIDSG